jgi:hypothetical protein
MALACAWGRGNESIKNVKQKNDGVEKKVPGISGDFLEII